MRVQISILLIVASCTAWSGCAEGSGANQPVSTAQHTKAVAEPVTDKVLTIWRDCSGSGSENELRQMAPELLDAIKQRSQLLAGVQVIRFANGNTSIWSEYGVRFVWGPQPVIKEFVEPDLETAPLEVKMFVEKRAEYIKQAQEQHEQEKARKIQDYQTKVDSELAKLCEYLIQKPKSTAPCTPFKSLGTRIEREGTTCNLIITDGWADCPNEGRTLSVAKIQGDIAVLQLARQRDLQVDEQAFAQREAFLRTIFPTAEVVPSFMPTKAIESLLK